MFHELRRKDRELKGERVLELLNSSEYGILNLGTSDNGYAYGIPISYAYDEETSTLYFHGANEGEKLNQIRRNNKVSLCIVGTTEPLPNVFSTKYESVIVFGDAIIIVDEEEKRKALRLLVLKYAKEYIPEGDHYIDKSWNRNTAFKIDIKHITAKARY